MDYQSQKKNNGNTNFINMPTKINKQLTKGFSFINDIIRDSGNLNENINKLEDQVKKDVVGKNDNYVQITSGLLYGILYDKHNNYYQYLYVVTKDNYDVFFQLLFTLVDSDHMELSNSVFLQIYDIFDKLVHMSNNKMIDIMLLVCRSVYPGINKLEKPNELLSFFEFIKNKLNWIMENSGSVNLSGLVFFKVVRILTETHMYSKSSNTDSKQREVFQQIVNVQIAIINRLWTARQDDIIKIGRELVRILIPLSRSEIEVAIRILETLTKQSREGESLYHQLMCTPHPIAGYNAFVQINIPPLMERMLIFILTKVKKSTGHYQRYFTWLNRKFKIETGVGNTMIIDISRYIVTCYFFYKTNTQVSDYTPRWLVLGYLLSSTKNELISGEIKQSLFFDWLQFNKDRDHLFLIEPGLLIMFQSARDYSEITMELIEYLDNYCEYFDSNQAMSNRHCVCEAFKEAEARLIIPDLTIILNEEKIRNYFKTLYAKLINYSSNTAPNTALSPKSFNSSDQYSMGINSNNVLNNQLSKQQPNSKGTIESPQSQLMRDLQIDNEQSINNSNINILTSNTSSNNLNNNNNPAINTIESNISISQPLINLIQPVTLKNFLSFKSTQTFHSFLDDLCKGYLTTFAAKNELETKLVTLKPEYISLINNFVFFYLNIFKEELLLMGPEDPKTKVSLFFFEYLFMKNTSNEFNFLCNIAKQLIESQPMILVFFIYTLTSRNIKTQEPKAHFNLLSKIYDHDTKQLKEKMNLFFILCVDNFDSNALNYVIENGFVIFHSLFFDDEELLCNLIIYSNIQSINSICLQFIFEQFILFDKKLYSIIALALELNQNEQNKLWLLITSQCKMPSTNLREFIGKMVEMSNVIVTKGSSFHISFFKHFLMAIKTCFKAEINDKSFIDYWGIFEFNVGYAKYVHKMILVILCLCSAKNTSGLFFNQIDEFIKYNSGNEGKMRNMILILNEICKMETIGISSSSNNIIGSNATSSLLFDGSNSIQKLMSKFEGRFKG